MKASKATIAEACIFQSGSGEWHSTWYDENGRPVSRHEGESYGVLSGVVKRRNPEVRIFGDR